MSRLIRAVALFVAGTAFGVFLMQPGAAQQRQDPGLRLNHVGVFATDFNESFRFYTETMGFREAFTVRDDQGNPRLAYLHITRDTFLELAPATGDRVAGLSHIGIWPEDEDAAIALLRQRGVEIADPRTGATGTRITNAVDPDGVQLEFVDIIEGSAPADAIASWQP